jgi:hypothetical protein
VSKRSGWTPSHRGFPPELLTVGPLEVDSQTLGQQRLLTPEGRFADDVTVAEVVKARRALIVVSLVSTVCGGALAWALSFGGLGLAAFPIGLAATLISICVFALREGARRQLGFMLGMPSRLRWSRGPFCRWWWATCAFSSLASHSATSLRMLTLRGQGWGRYLSGDIPVRSPRTRCSSSPRAIPRDCDSRRSQTDEEHRSERAMRSGTFPHLPTVRSSGPRRADRPDPLGVARRGIFAS